ncbi:MAG: nucleotidyltransferase family protein [Planctomycetota bacterium]|jgi:glucose-1-phosphate thymidylyltransferase
MKAILLCAGYATRLRPLTENCPKHLLEVKGKPIITHVIDKIKELPIDALYVVTNNKFYTHFEEWSRTMQGLKIPLKVINDGTLSNDDRLGSIGDVAYALRTEGIDDDLFVINADNIFTFDLKPFYAQFMEKKNVIACYDVRDLKEARKMGAPTMDSDGKVVGFVEKPENPTSTEVSIGLYLYSKGITSLVFEYIAGLEARGQRPDTTGDFVEWLAGKLPIYTHTFGADTDHWIDIGTPEQYENAKNSDLF